MVNNYRTIDSRKYSLEIRQWPVTIEFVGPPGAGKTTSCRYFSSSFKKQGYNVCTLSELKKYVSERTYTEKFFIASKLIAFKSKSIIQFILSLVKNNIYSLNSIYRFVRLHIFDIALNQLIKQRKIDIVLLDQWIIQEIWSATIFKCKNYENMSMLLSKFFFKIDAVVYLDVDIITASNRMEMRNTNLSRFDRMKEDQRKVELQKYNKYLHQLYDSSICKKKILLSGKERPEDNITELIKHFDKQLQII